MHYSTKTAEKGKNEMRHLVFKKCFFISFSFCVWKFDPFFFAPELFANTWDSKHDDEVSKGSGAWAKRHLTTSNDDLKTKTKKQKWIDETIFNFIFTQCTIFNWGKLWSENFHSWLKQKKMSDKTQKIK